ncbi:MAG: BolA family protein [Planktomarina sp.]
MSNMAEQIREKLQSGLSPSVLSVNDVSEAHRGHAGFQEGGESHFDVVIASAAFTGKTRIAQHRAIHAAIGKDIMSRIHALGIMVEKN